MFKAFQMISPSWAGAFAEEASARRLAAISRNSIGRFSADLPNLSMK
jgi:hypothetical protein